MAQKWPPPRRVDHQKFCETEGWSQVRDARGRSGTHHVTFELSTSDGCTLRTRISHPVDRSDYGASMWSHILRDQLDVDEDAFWACVNEYRTPDRGEPERPTEPIPAGVVAILLRDVGLSEAEVAGMTRDEAIARVNNFWTSGT